MVEYHLNSEDRLVLRDTLQEDVLRQESSELLIFEFKQIIAVTDHFSYKNKLGEGGFEAVYKGMLDDGKQVAVKRLSGNSAQGIEEFKNEIMLISKLQHRNLVKLLGCCVEGKERLLIYEYMPNKSLDTFLFDSKKRRQLDWATRFNIIQGIGQGLVYLHRDSCLRIIHRDLKCSNILLDEKMNPKISDFGLARSFQITQELANTRRIVGTYGYMSPEYAMGGVISEKSDAFSYGVMLLEIMSGKRNTEFIHEEQIYPLAHRDYRLYHTLPCFDEYEDEQWYSWACDGDSGGTSSVLTIRHDHKKESTIMGADDDESSFKSHSVKGDGPNMVTGGPAATFGTQPVSMGDLQKKFMSKAMKSKALRNTIDFGASQIYFYTILKGNFPTNSFEEIILDAENHGIQNSHAVKIWYEVLFENLVDGQIVEVGEAMSSKDAPHIDQNEEKVVKLDGVKTIVNKKWSYAPFDPGGTGSEPNEITLEVELLGRALIINRKESD
ncbi:putative protein kinase RLK-Pelle-DLSV family [Helianthus anomalus]